ncbi:MAG TPA: DUF397 domain-containing protein [Pseudonocardiaceae bacterium]
MPTEKQGGWRKSSYSGGTSGTDCVEVAFVASEVGVRDSKNAGGPRLNFPETAWRSFVSRRAQGQAHPTVPCSCG